MRRLAKLVVAMVLAGVTPLAFGQPAAALTCVGPTDVLRSAESVFAGKVTEISQREARIQVDAVWKGTVGREVKVKLQWIRMGGPLPAKGERYVVALQELEPANNCTMWPASDQYVRSAIATTFNEPAQRYDVKTSAPGGGATTTAVVLGGLALITAGATVTWRLAGRRGA